MVDWEVGVLSSNVCESWTAYEKLVFYATSHLGAVYLIVLFWILTMDYSKST